MKILLSIITALIFICLLIIYNIITRFDPATASNFVLYLLYTTFAIFLTLTLSLIIFWIKNRFIFKSIVIQAFYPSIRQAFLISSTLVILFVLHMLGVLTYWDAIPIILAFFFLELFFQSEKIPTGQKNLMGKPQK